MAAANRDMMFKSAQARLYASGASDLGVVASGYALPRATTPPIL
jgi:hypothetical protein